MDLKQYQLVSHQVNMAYHVVAKFLKQFPYFRGALPFYRQLGFFFFVIKQYEYDKFRITKTIGGFCKVQIGNQNQRKE
jgi:hypothetical protein